MSTQANIGLLRSLPLVGKSFILQHKVNVFFLL